MRVFAIRPAAFACIEFVTAQEATWGRRLPRQIGLQLLRGLGDEVMLALVIVRQPCGGIVLPSEDSVGHECIVVCSYGVKIVREAEIHQANAVPNKCIV